MSRGVRHLDLFSGIGGFAYAADQVWDNVEHIFCDNDIFCQKVIKKHWPESEIYGDIRTIREPIKTDIITGGFPCQPFSQVGKRKGTDDNRWLWPEMLRVIELTKPTWIIAENVIGLLTMQGGVVFEQICLDLEAIGYEVQPFIIPACAVQAPHRRDRLWVVAHANRQDVEGRWEEPQGNRLEARAIPIPEIWETREGLLPETVLCRTDDGIPNRVDRTKSLGNAIVPQVAIEIMKGMTI